MRTLVISQAERYWLELLNNCRLTLFRLFGTAPVIPAWRARLFARLGIRGFVPTFRVSVA